MGYLGRLIREVAFSNSSTPLFVNIHPNELSSRWLVRPDDPIYIHETDVFLEITESAPLTHFELCLDVLKEVRNRGNIHLVIDDFGSGYSNILRIVDLEPTFVKLDRTFLQDVVTQNRRRVLIKSMVRLCEDLGIFVIAEGIETKEHLDIVRDCGVQYGQGYYLSLPTFPAQTDLEKK